MSQDEHEFNPKSINATLATILANQENAVSTQRNAMNVLSAELRAHREETRAGFDRMGTKVGTLEQWRDNIKAKLAVVSAGVSLACAVGLKWIEAKFGGHGQ